ncbi:dihydrodipicolinate synthase [Oleiphilus messinensis]|uniref:4-hydroxy-tetrahydrodipicolinate synthase n=1 Tax=Oleiphilus messinensis TaxID=141451 RepID=A0A1Y0IJ32_9GAMM|nr:4-hydroxy-tetrahydrodipicolinate synthase [Oleiphilus messinensis]ARU59404.1 dihydrodipicolinate synthase [Oleiphilus messinensis]
MFYGSYVALITPFRNGEIDESALRKIVRWHIESGSHGLIPMGTTGEASTVTEQEHKRVIEIVVEETAGQIPVIAGAGSNNPNEAITYAHSAQSAGADAVLAVAGYYNRPNQAGLYAHFQLLHDHTDIPIIIYNIPPRTIVDIQPETLAKLSELPRVVGVKDATQDLGRISQERRLINKPFSYFSGEDITALAYNAMGGNGCISVTANVAPRLCSELQRACQQGNFSHALMLHERLMLLHQALFREPSPSGIKYAVSLLGHCHEDVRLPMMPITNETRTMIKSALQSLELV